MVQVSQQLRDPARFEVVGEHGQVLDLGPDGEVGFVGRVLPLQGNQHIGKGGGISQDLSDLLLQVLGLAALQEQIALDQSTSVGLAASRWGDTPTVVGDAWGGIIRGSSFSRIS